MFNTVWGWNNNCLHKTVFFHQLDMQIDLIPIIPQAIELYISLLYRNQNLPHEVHVSFHPSPLL